MTILNNKKIYELLSQIGLENVSPETAESVEAILGELDKKKLLGNTGNHYFVDRSTLETTGFLRAIVQQNWVLIAQNEKIINELKSHSGSNHE